MSEDPTSQLAKIEQGIEQFLEQKKQFGQQMIEVEAALKELSSTDSAYKIVGNFMIKTDVKKSIKELQEKKETLEIRIKSAEKQEENLQHKRKELQEEILKSRAE